MPTIEQIRFVFEIAKAGSISQAAKNLYTSQPYLSIVLKDIEQELNVFLFERNNKGVTPTQQGNLFIEYAEELLALMQRIETLQYQTTEHHETSLTVVSTYALIMHEIFSQFYTTCRETQWQLSYMERPNSKVFEKLAANQADLGILHFDPKRGKQQLSLYASNHLEFFPLYCDDVCILVGKNHPLFVREYISLDELLPFSLVTSKNTNTALVERFFTNKQIRLDPIIFDNGRNLIHYVSQSAASYSFGLPVLNINDPLLKTGNIKYLKIIDHQYQIQVGYLLRKDQKRNPALEAYISFLKSFFHQLQPEGISEG